MNAGMFVNTKEYEGHTQKEQDKDPDKIFLFHILVWTNDNLKKLQIKIKL